MTGNKAEYNEEDDDSATREVQQQKYRNLKPTANNQCQCQNQKLSSTSGTKNNSNGNNNGTEEIT